MRDSYILNEPILCIAETFRHACGSTVLVPPRLLARPKCVGPFTPAWYSFIATCHSDPLRRPAPCSLDFCEIQPSLPPAHSALSPRGDSGRSSWPVRGGVARCSELEGRGDPKPHASCKRLHLDQVAGSLRRSP